MIVISILQDPMQLNRSCLAVFQITLQKRSTHLRKIRLSWSRASFHKSDPFTHPRALRPLIPDPRFCAGSAFPWRHTRSDAVHSGTCPRQMTCFTAPKTNASPDRLQFRHLIDAQDSAFLAGYGHTASARLCTLVHR